MLFSEALPPPTGPGEQEHGRCVACRRKYYLKNYSSSIINGIYWRGSSYHSLSSVYFIIILKKNIY